MDPADLGLAHQGTRLGQHEDMLHGIMETLWDPYSRISSPAPVPPFIMHPQ